MKKDKELEVRMKGGRLRQRWKGAGKVSEKEMKAEPRGNEKW